MSQAAMVVDFCQRLTIDDIPDAVRQHARWCLLDTLAVGFGGSTTPMSRLLRGHAVRHYGPGAGGAARLLADGRATSVVGAALAGAGTIDSLDGHDGHDLTKGHVGASVIPALLAFADREGVPATGAELLTRLVVGYEIGTRAGIALHATAADYHTSGAWNALAAAAIGARTLRLDHDRTQHAFGIAEYHGPRSPMMRCIDHPTMVKDGSAHGAAAGTEAALLAEAGFTGAPADTLTTADTATLWTDLGQRWRISEQYRKPYPVCRWAHPAVTAGLAVADAHRVRAAEITTVDVSTFHQATRLATSRPDTTEQAQYSLPFALATALVHGGIDPAQLTGAALNEPEVLRLADRVHLREEPAYTRAFPAERIATVTLTLRDGRGIASQPTTAPGGPDQPLTDRELHAKFTTYTQSILDPARADTLIALVDSVDTADSIRPLLDIALAGPGPRVRSAC